MRRAGLSLGLCLALAACAPAPEATPPIFPPTATEAPIITAATVTPAEIIIPLPSAPELAETLTPTPVIACANDSSFDSDLTVPDGSQFLPGQAFVKKWGVKNAGTCNWGPGYRLVQVSGEALGAPNELALYPAKSGTMAVFEIPMAAPAAPGVYASRWQARDPDGRLFGDFVTVQIEVIVPPETSTPT